MPVGFGRWWASRSRRREVRPRNDVAPPAATPEADVDVPAPVPPRPAQPTLAVVPEVEPELQAEPGPERTMEREPAAAPVASLAARQSGPREWNLWDLERIAKAHSGGDAVRDEERSFLLMYLREFANADGVLPADFDAIVRESFGDVLDATHS